MIADLMKDGLPHQLWQLPYFTPKNKLVRTIVKDGYEVRNEGGKLPYEDAVLDFTNPATVKWYQGKLANLLNMGVGAIKVDFGEAAPLNGLYASGRTGFYEHNLYPLALQQSGGRHHQGSHRRKHHLGPQRLGGQPALSVALGRRRREHRLGHGGGTARRVVVWSFRIFLLEPRCRRICR